MADRDTIFALSSGRPPAAIAVVRVSGPRAGDAVVALAGRLPVPRRAMLARLRNAGTGDASPLDTVSEPIDDALVLWFPGPQSETGEDKAGVPARTAAALRWRAMLAKCWAVCRRPDRRAAEPGEFARRAWPRSGKPDLTGVEGLADLIGAETEAQRRQAYRQLAGALGEQAERWRGRLIEALALVEALIDFPEERWWPPGDLPGERRP